MKMFLKIFVGLLVVIVIAVAGFLYTFNANDYKEELTGIAETIVGRPVGIAGDIEISLYPLIGIKIDDMTIDNPPGFSKKTFASVGQFDIKIEIMPLIQKRLNVETLMLNNLTVDLEKNVAGENNWSDLTGDSESHSARSESGLAGFAVGGVEMVGANITWLDSNTGKRLKVSNMKLATEAVIKGQPLPLTFNAHVKSSQPVWQGSAFVKTKLKFEDDSPVFNANELKLVIKALLPSSPLEKISVAMIADGEVNVQTQTAKLSKAKLSVLGLVMNGELGVENIFSVPVIQGPLKVKTFEAEALAKRFKITLPQMENAQSLKNVSLKTLFKTDFGSIYMDDILAKVDDSQVRGSIHITGMQKPVVSYDLDVDKINLNNYRVVDGGSDQGETMLPLDLIRSGELEGTFDVESVTAGEIELEKLHIISSIKDSILKVAPVTMLVGESEVQATIELDAREEPVGEVSVKVNNVDAKASINPLLKSVMGNDALNLEGMVNADANLKAAGTSMAALKRSAEGTITINMDKPIVQGIDLDHVSRFNVSEYANKNGFKTRKSFVTEYKPDRKTEFDNLTATFKVSNSKWVNDDLLLVSEKADITGSGSIDFINSKLDYRPVIDIKVENAVDIRDKLRNYPMEYHASGSFEKISHKFNVDKYELLVGRLLLQEAKERSIRRSKRSTWQNIKSE
jgi:AsmA protein